MNLEPVKYPYDTKIKWKEEKKGILKSEGKPEIMVACPPEFGGHPGIWAPGDLFVGSIEVCLMTTFLWHANREKIQMNSYASNARGIVEQVKGKPRFSSVTIKISVGVISDNDKVVAEKIFKKLKHGCLVSNSIDTNLQIDSEIIVSNE